MKYRPETCRHGRGLIARHGPDPEKHGRFAVRPQSNRSGFHGRLSMNEKYPIEGFRDIILDVNRKEFKVAVQGNTPLLWVIRERLHLTGTKYGCGKGRCGACAALMDGKALRSSMTPVSKAAGKRITTIEGLSGDGSQSLQRAWIEGDVPRCGTYQRIRKAVHRT